MCKKEPTHQFDGSCSSSIGSYLLFARFTYIIFNPWKWLVYLFSLWWILFQNPDQISYVRGHKRMMLHIFSDAYYNCFSITCQLLSFSIQVNFLEPLQPFLECFRTCFLWQLDRFLTLFLANMQLYGFGTCFCVCNLLITYVRLARFQLSLSCQCKPWLNRYGHP